MCFIFLFLKVSLTGWLAAAGLQKVGGEAVKQCQWSKAAPENHHCPLLASICLQFCAFYTIQYIHPVSVREKETD